MHPHQHAYQPGKSCESALHQLVARIEETLAAKEIALGAFLDIEGAFDNTSFSSMIHAAENKGIEPTVCRWIKSMLLERTAVANLFDETAAVKIVCGCPQGGVLSPLLWDLVVNSLLVKLNSHGIYTQGYADDIAILIRGKFTSTVFDLMQKALQVVEEWCGEENLRVNPSKTALVAFTRKRLKENMYKPPVFYNKTLELNTEVKYLGLTIDKKLTWNSHLHNNIVRGKRLFMSGRRTCGKTWGLKPTHAHWLYTQIIRPTITYGAAIWWPKTNQQQALTKLNSLQRLALLCITGAMSSTPTTAMEAFLSLTPLDLFIKGEARLGAYRLQASGNWRTGRNTGHSTIINLVTEPAGILLMGSDQIQKQYSFKKPFQVNLNWKEWNAHTDTSKSIMWFTDGSKTTEGTGSGVHGVRPRHNICFPLGQFSTVFQAEVAAISWCLAENLRRRYQEKQIFILSDSQAALKALLSHVITSKLVWECLQLLNTLGNQNKVTLVWVPGHKGIEGNEKADQLARKGATTTFVGPEPALGVTKSCIRGVVSQWMLKEHQKRWELKPDAHHIKELMSTPIRPFKR